MPCVEWFKNQEGYDERDGDDFRNCFKYGANRGMCGAVYHKYMRNVIGNTMCFNQLSLPNLCYRVCEHNARPRGGEGAYTFVVLPGSPRPLAVLLVIRRGNKAIA